MSDRKTIVIAAGAALVLFAGAMGAGAWVMLQNGGGIATGDLAGAVDGGEQYEPTSGWIEEGLDPNVTTFGFEGKTPEPTGPPMDERQVQSLVYAKQNSLMQCYADALAENPDLQGKVFLKFGIAPDGHVAMVKVTDSSLRSKPTEDCLVEKARTWDFPQTNRSTLLQFETDFTFVYE
jgi:hypothetical protein